MFAYSRMHRESRHSACLSDGYAEGSGFISLRNLRSYSLGIVSRHLDLKITSGMGITWVWNIPARGGSYN